MKHLIKSARWEMGEGGFACGPVAGPVVAEAEIETEDGSTAFYTLAEVEGIPNPMKSEESVLELCIKDELSLEETVIFEDSQIDYGCSYEDFFSCKDEIEGFDIFRYLIYVVRADFDETDKFIADTVGKYLEDIDVPSSDVEEDFEYENGSEDED